MIIPKIKDIEVKLSDGDNITPLEQFIWEHEPSNKVMKDLFYTDLNNLIEFIESK